MFDFKAVVFPFEMLLDKFKLFVVLTFKVALMLSAAKAYLNFKLKAISVVLEIQ